MRVEHRLELQTFRPLARLNYHVAVLLVGANSRCDLPAIRRVHGLDLYPSGLRIGRQEDAVSAPGVRRLHGRKRVERRKQPPHHHGHNASERAYGELFHQAGTCAAPAVVSMADAAEARANAGPEATEVAA